MTFDSEKVLRGLARFQRDPSKKTSKRKRSETAAADAGANPPPPPSKKNSNVSAPNVQISSPPRSTEEVPPMPRPEVENEMQYEGEFCFGRREDAEFPPMSRIFVPNWNLKEDESITSNPVSARRFVQNSIPPADRKEIGDLPSDLLQNQFAVAVSRVLCLGWEGSSRMISYERENDELKTELARAKDAREELTRKVVEKDGDISRLRSESEEKSLLIAGHRKKMSSTKSELEGLRRESMRRGEEINSLKEQIKSLEAKYKALEDKSDYANALAFNFGYERLKSNILEDHPEIDLSAYNPPEVNEEEEEEGEEEEVGEAEGVDEEAEGVQSDVHESTEAVVERDAAGEK